MANLQRFGRWLKGAIEAANLNQVGLAVKMGVSEAAVSDWVRGNREPGEDNLRKMARVLGLPVAELYVALGRVPPQEPGEEPWLREVRARLRAASPEERERVLAVIRAMLLKVESGQKPCSGDTDGVTSESEP